MSRIAFPDWLQPMAATLTYERFSGPEWLFERKYDGIRLLTYRRGRQVRLLSRNRLPQQHPAIEAAVLALPVHDVILDGEVAWHGGSAYHVFDILWLDGENVTCRPLHERRTLLSRLPFVAPLRRVVEIKGPKPWDRARNEGWEGVIEIVVQAAFIEWTVHGKLRHPRLVGIREDKSPREVVRETS